jgi:lysine-specific demethylase/histidyl-hydroxylase NO66
MLTPAVHSSAMDFLMNRLPPHPKQLPARGPAPTMDDRVWCRLAGWAYLLPFELTGMNCDDDDDDAGGAAAAVLAGG